MLCLPCKLTFDHLEAQTGNDPQNGGLRQSGCMNFNEWGTCTQQNWEGLVNLTSTYLYNLRLGCREVACQVTDPKTV